MRLKIAKGLFNCLWVVVSPCLLAQTENSPNTFKEQEYSTSQAIGRTQAVIEIPLTHTENWQQLSYRNIPANRVRFTDGGLQVDTNRSASPLIYPIEPAYLQKITFHVDIRGSLNLNDQQQGQSGADDFLFRLGVVYEGDHRLNWLQKQFASEWIKTLHKLAPADTGISHIHFFNVYSNQSLENNTRTHPVSDLMIETFAFAKPDNHQLSADITPDATKRVLALWVSIDGDDTQSSFSVLLKKLSVEYRH